jgi:hypothetical protein
MENASVVRVLPKPFADSAIPSLSRIDKADLVKDKRRFPDIEGGEKETSHAHRRTADRPVLRESAEAFAEVMANADSG